MHRQAFAGAQWRRTTAAFRLLRAFAPPLLIGLAYFSITASASAATFTGTGTGAIPDGGTPTPACAAARNVNFAVSGIAAPIGSVSVAFTVNPGHTWIGDLQVSLLAPNATTHLLFSRVGANSATDFGDDADLSGTYTFTDSAVNNIWTVAASSANGNFIVTPGSYRTQAAGPNASDSPGPAFTSMNSTFSSLSPANRNGNWTLRFEDCSAGDVGTVSAATLTLLPVTAGGAAISGRVLTSEGAGIRNARVYLSGADSDQPKSALTGPFGYYRFEDVEAARTYIITVSSKRYAFAQPTVAVTANDDLAGIDFIAEP